MYTLKVDEMSCNHCVGTVTKTLQALDPAAKVAIDLAAKSVQVDTSATLEQVVAAIDDAGYPVLESAVN